MNLKETEVKEEVCVLIKVEAKYTIEFLIMIITCQELCNRFYKSKKFSKIDDVFSVLGPFDVFLEISEKKYLFSWNEVPGKDSERFLEFLKDDLKVCCAKKSEIKKLNDGKTIKVSNMVELTHDKKNNLTVKKMGSKVCHNYILKTEYDKLNIYSKDSQKKDEYAIHEKINKTIFRIRETLGSYIHETHTLTKFELSEFLKPVAKNLFDNPQQINELKDLFNWNDITGNDDERLIGFLKKEYDIKWVDNAKIEKIDDGKTISISYKDNSLSLKLNNDETKAILKIDDGTKNEFNIEKEKDKLNIYYDQKMLFNWNDITGNDNKKLIGFLKEKYDIKWVDNAKIEKIDDGKTISISYKDNSLSLKLNNDETKAILKIDDGTTDKFIADKENKISDFNQDFIMFLGILSKLIGNSENQQMHFH